MTPERIRELAAEALDEITRMGITRVGDRNDRVEVIARAIALGMATEYGLVEPFDIDNGQLEGLTPQKCFVLGYELAQLSAEWEAGESPKKPVHPENRERLQAAAEKRGRTVTFTVYHDDWLWMETVG